MIPNDFVYKQIFSGALKVGATQSAATSEAVTGLQKYKRSQISAGNRKKVTVGDMIQWHINEAKRRK